MEHLSNTKDTMGINAKQALRLSLVPKPELGTPGIAGWKTQYQEENNDGLHEQGKTHAHRRMSFGDTFCYAVCPRRKAVAAR